MEREEQVRALIARLRVKAIQSREEGQRIRLTVHVATDAESNCHVRAEVWDDVANELEALLAQAQPSPQMTAMQMLQKCLAVVVGYEHTLSWPNHPNNEDMQAAAMDTTIAIEDAMLKLREEIGEAQPVADAPNDQLIFNGVVYVRAGAQPPAEGLREQLAKEYYEYNVGNSLGIKFEQMGPEAQNAFRKQADNWLPIVQSVLLARVPQAAPKELK